MLCCKNQILEPWSIETVDAGTMEVGDTQASFVTHVLIVGGLATFKDSVAGQSGATVARVQDTLQTTAHGTTDYENELRPTATKRRDILKANQRPRGLLERSVSRRLTIVS